MLLDKPIAKNDIVTVKLTSGEEILGCYVDDNDKELILQKIATVSATPDGKMGLIPWMLTSEATNIKLNKNTVVTFAATETEIAKGYTHTTSSIQLV